MEKQKLFIEEDWLIGNTCVFNIINPIDRSIARTKIENMRRNFVKKLEQEGFVITTDKGKLENTIYLTMNEAAIASEDVPLDEYKKLFDKRMLEAGGSLMKVPHSVDLEAFFNNPFFPAVFKNELTNGGKDKLLIETEEQLEKMKRFYHKYNSIPELKEILNSCIFQQYIETPTKYKTYLRVLAGASGDIMGATLRYSSLNETKTNIEGTFEKYFCVPESEYYLNCKNMFGYYSGGGEISFSQPKYSDEKKKILAAHNIDPDNPTVPEQVKIVCENIMVNCNKELGIICGMDFIQNEEDGTWYYLENQAFPAVDEWAKPNGINLPSQNGSIKNYLKNLEIDLLARHEALNLLMSKQKVDDNPPIQKTLSLEKTRNLNKDNK